MPKPSELLQSHCDEVLRVVAAHRGTNPRVFGSIARNADSPDSDLDILVDVPRGTGLFSLGATQFELQELLGIPVAVLTLNDLPARLGDSVAREAKPL